jgi:hypothetical protein
MGKAARNEIRKIRATFLNNIAVGMFITGFAVPYFAFAAKTVETGGGIYIRAFTPDETKIAFAGLISMALAFALSMASRNKARKILEEIED